LIELPSLFKGRGDHPKSGYLKSRIYPEDVCLNLSADAPVPKCNMKGHAWKAILHDSKVNWLAVFREEAINNS
jgi:DNA topoisomerase I